MDEDENIYSTELKRLESDFETSVRMEELGFINRRGRPKGGDALVVGYQATEADTTECSSIDRRSHPKPTGTGIEILKRMHHGALSSLGAFGTQRHCGCKFILAVYLQYEGHKCILAGYISKDHVETAKRP
jgi:hypothetical protein